MKNTAIMPYNDFYSQCLFNCQRITVSINSFLVIITEKNLFDGQRIRISSIFTFLSFIVTVTLAFHSLHLSLLFSPFPHSSIFPQKAHSLILLKQKSPYFPVKREVWTCIPVYFTSLLQSRHPGYCRRFCCHRLAVHLLCRLVHPAEGLPAHRHRPGTFVQRLPEQPG